MVVNMRTKQEILDIVVPHARKIIKDPSLLSCRFKVTDPDDNRLPCFIGALIPNDVEFSTSDNVFGLTKYNPHLKEFFCVNLQFLNELQVINDESNIRDWIGQLKDLAEAHELRFPE
jgi:hypothetical protein